ncbi:MAG: SRPBCC family protein [Alphaproteobacteria bacterium]|nr:SRPBCC family protein [Alphaproteobacteria bacterium]
MKPIRLWSLVVALVPALVVLPAQAHGPTRQKVVEKIEINAAADKVWAVIGNFHNMGWHPAFVKTEGEGGNEVGASRTLVLESGDKIVEKLIAYSTDKKSYKYEITNVDVKVVPVSNYSATISVKGDDDKSTVQWKGAFYRGYVNNDPPPELSDEAAVKAITGVYKSGLDALKKKVESGG